jgi:hypothetical protein
MSAAKGSKSKIYNSMDEDRKQIKHIPRNTNAKLSFVFAKAHNLRFCLWAVCLNFLVSLSSIFILI